MQVRSGPLTAIDPVGVSIDLDAPGTAGERKAAIKPMQIVAAAVGCGVVFRLGWTPIGLPALARRRRRARPAGAECPSLHCVTRRARGRSGIMGRCGGPVAFGLLRPAVLVPESLLASGGDRLDAVLAHELVHLRSRDWLFVLAEELLLAFLWFHP
ncbi:MAG: M56 family metallopeptidase [Bryobacterales bacterium]